MDQMNWICQRTDTSKRRLLLLDGGYDVNAFFAGLPGQCTALVRCARNRKLYYLAQEPTARARRGRPCKYGEISPKPAQYLHDRSGWKSETVRVRGRDYPVRYRVEGPFLVETASRTPLFLIAVGGIDRKINGKRVKRQPCFYLVNADIKQGKWTPPMTAPELLVYAHQRWEIEVCDRELKTSFGLGQMQCWAKRSALLSVQWMAWPYAVLMLAGCKTWGGQLRGAIRSTSPWFVGSRRWSFNNLWQGYRQALWNPQDFLGGLAAVHVKPGKH